MKKKDRGVSAKCDFEVVDETEDWIVVEKPAPLVVHPTGGKDEPSLLGGLQALLSCELAGGRSLSILTRLDRETSGLVLVAKHVEAAREFARQFEARRVLKEYLALVHGWPEWTECVCRERILRQGEVGFSPVWVRQVVHAEGKDCETGFVVERRFEREECGFAMIRCFPKTGRMHQIRVHLEHLGHGIVGDKLYGTDGVPYLEQVTGELSDASRSRLILPRQALHAARLAVEVGGNTRDWESALPPDLARFLEASV
ncbi:MAG: RluA family pseudouridine synthase [Verrucomicrobiales bacterium]